MGREAGEATLQLPEAQRKALDGADTNTAKLRERFRDIRTGVTAVTTFVEPAPKTAHRFTRYKEQWKRISEQHRGTITWEEVKKRLMANNGHYLSLAKGLHNGGILFGVDKKGNPLIADAGGDPIEFGPEFWDLTYAQAREAVTMKDGGKGKKVSIGYELFPYAGGQNWHRKSSEILTFEAVAPYGLFIVPPKQRKRTEWRGSWLESGDSPSLPRLAIFDPTCQKVRIYIAHPEGHIPGLGVRRLLRVKTAF